MIPEHSALIEEWKTKQDQMRDCDRITQQILRDALQSIFSGLITLEQRITSLGNQEWKGSRQIHNMQDELISMRYKMVLFEKSLGDNHE